jgi:hypothetical protein
MPNELDTDTEIVPHPGQSLVHNVCFLSAAIVHNDEFHAGQLLRRPKELQKGLSCNCYMVVHRENKSDLHNAAEHSSQQMQTAGGVSLIYFD